MLINNFWKAYQGKIIWKMLESKYNADCFILMPHMQDDYNYYALLHLNKFIRSRGAHKTVILSYDEGVLKSYSYFKTEGEVKAIKMSENKIEKLIKYYALYEFSTKLTIISLTKPYDTCAENLLGIKGVTKQDLLCFDIYRFNETPEVIKPDYSGDDQVVIEFMGRTNLV